jgi:hypothetical protein
MRAHVAPARRAPAIQAEAARRYRTKISHQAMPRERTVFSAATIASARRRILWAVVVGFSTAAVLLQRQAGWVAAVTALLQCLMLAAIIREIEHRPAAAIRWSMRFAAAVRSRRAIAIASILLILAIAASHVLAQREDGKWYSSAQLVWLSVELAAAAGIGFLATTRRGTRVTPQLTAGVSLFLAVFCFNVLIGTLVLSTNSAQALAPELLRDNAARLALIILASTPVTLISAWAMGPAVLAAERRPGKNVRGYRSLDGGFLVLFALLIVHWVPRLSQA